MTIFSIGHFNFKMNQDQKINFENLDINFSFKCWNLTVKSKSINNIRFLETPGASYQDTSFAFKTTASAERFILLNDTYVHYRQDNENSSVKSKDKIFVICEEYKEIEKYLDVNPKIKVLAETYKWINQ